MLKQLVNMGAPKHTNGVIKGTHFTQFEILPESPQ